MLAARVRQSLAPKSITWGGVRIETSLDSVRTDRGDFGLVSAQDNDASRCSSATSRATASARRSLPTASTPKSSQKCAAVRRSASARRLDRFVLQSIGGSSFLFSAAAARFDRGGRCMVFTGAGHPPGWS